ncbi:MAG: hypothetical protein BRC58_05665 [Cyanobacteria bacterium QS_8_64_29]|nr:MAG: hypothetical protein BRC58_05665 [Cyanobacteria bacterium QS_8_64_29]
MFFVHSAGIGPGASGAVFGLFTISVLLKFRWNWRNLLEVLILGQFVVQRLLSELQSLGQADAISHTAHVSGALVGAILVLLLKRLKDKRQPSSSALER